MGAIPAPLISSAQGEEVVPGLGRLPALLVEQRLVVPEAVDLKGVVQDQDLAAVVAGLDRHRVQGVPDLAAVDRLGVEQRGQVGQLAGVGERGQRQLLGARVVDHVRGVAAVEAGLQLLADVGDAGVLDLGAAELLLVQLLVELGVVVAVAALEDDDVQRGVGLHPERVLGARLAAAAGARCRRRRWRSRPAGSRRRPRRPRPGRPAAGTAAASTGSGCSWVCRSFERSGESGGTPDASGVPGFQDAVVVVAAGDVGRQVDGGCLAGLEQPPDDLGDDQLGEQRRR